MVQACTALRGIAHDLGIDSRLALYRIRSLWSDIFKGPVSLHSYPADLSEGNLLVIVDSSVWLQEMGFLKTDLIRNLKPHGVDDIRLRLGRVHRSHGKAFTKEFYPLSEDDRAFIEEVVASVKDDVLGDSIKRAMSKWAAKGLKE